MSEPRLGTAVEHSTYNLRLQDSPGVHLLCEPRLVVSITSGVTSTPCAMTTIRTDLYRCPNTGPGCGHKNCDKNKSLELKRGKMFTVLLAGSSGYQSPETTLAMDTASLLLPAFPDGRSLVSLL